MQELILIIFLSSVLGQVWVLLIQPDYLFDWIPPLIEKIKYERIRHMLTCSVCMSGQFAFWTYLLYIVSRETYDPFDHVCIVAVTIWLTVITGKLFNP